VACAALKNGKPPEGAVAKLAMAESFLTAGPPLSSGVGSRNAG
jgi:hypothetical protein